MTLAIPIEDIEIPVHLRSNVGGIAELAKSLHREGLIRPIVVHSENGKPPYKLVVGYRRLIAAKQLGWSRIPCTVHNTSTGETL